MDGGNTLTLLSNLLHPPKEGEENDEQPEGVSPYINPGSIGPPKTSNSTNSTAVESSSTVKEKCSSGIWSLDEVSEATEIDINDQRPQPEYSMVFKQAVTPEDMFLGMNNKTPLTSACEDLLLRISLPDIEYKDVDLVVTNKHIDCQTPVHHLGLYLPHTVDPKSGKARWLSEEHVLELTLRIVREYDFLNN